MSGQASSSTAAAPGAPHPRPQGRAPKEHTWDGSYGESGAWLHNVTGLPWAKGGRSAASMAQQRERKREDKRDRSGRPEASGAQKRKKGAVEAERRDRNRRLNVINQYRTAARKKKKIPLDSSQVARTREEKRLLGDNFVHEGQRVRVIEGLHAGCCGVVLERAVLWECGRAVTAVVEPEHHHDVLLDEDEDEAGPRRISPYQVEPWPRVGQQVGLDLSLISAGPWLDLGSRLDLCRFAGCPASPTRSPR